jgi:hypothetical protein
MATILISHSCTTYFFFSGGPQSDDIPNARARRVWKGPRYSLYLLCWYKRTALTQKVLLVVSPHEYQSTLTSTKVQTVTHKAFY